MPSAAASERAALAAIRRHGALLVYPITNRREPRSLWYELYPRSEMRWAWDQGADERVVKLWHLRERLASAREVVYTKWYKGRALFFSRELFTAMLAVLKEAGLGAAAALSSESRELLQLLQEDSPQSSKRLRRAAGLAGKHNESLWTRAQRELWERLLIVGTGEVEDGAFPSLAIGATQLIFEPLWEEAGRGASAEQRALLAAQLPASSALGKHWQRILVSLARGPARVDVSLARVDRSDHSR
jgi:hypothetical protein